MKTINMFRLSTQTKRDLRAMTEPVKVVETLRGQETPLAVIVPYELFLRMQATLELGLEEHACQHGTTCIESYPRAPISASQSGVIRDRNGA